jgi:cell division protein FtsI (penicillin-binding protein 3)
VNPYILDAVFDHDDNNVYRRFGKPVNRERLLSPSMGIRVRRDMISSSPKVNSDMILHTDAIEQVRIQDGMSKYIMQEVLIAATPAKSPELLLFMVTQRDNLYPVPRSKKSGKISIRHIGKKLLVSLYDEEQKRKQTSQYIASAIPKGPDRANYNQFLISSRIDYQEKSTGGAGRVAVMPQLVGLSLRKGLQRLNEHSLQVKVQGSGQIVSQVPGPGEPLQGIGKCELTLGSEI